MRRERGRMEVWPEKVTPAVRMQDGNMWIRMLRATLERRESIWI
jgi:hypothetical protein